MTSPISFATPGMIPALKKLWSACFGDEGGYTDYIFGSLLTPEHILAAARDGEPVSMACMQPFTLESQGRDAAGMYLFGVATLPEYQGQGLSTALLEECHRVLAAQNMALSVLVPASESLFGFYGARGYELFASVQKALFRRGEVPPHSIGVSPAGPGALAAVRARFYAGRAYVKWEERYLRYIAGECRMLGGGVLLLTAGKESGYAVCYPSEERVTVKEIVFPEQLLPEAAAAILAHFGREECLVYLPAETQAPVPNKVLPFAMVRWYDREKQKLAQGASPYIAHVLDD